MKANVILKKAAELFIIAKSPKVNLQSRVVATHKFKTTADIWSAMIPGNMKWGVAEGWSSTESSAERPV